MHSHLHGRIASWCPSLQSMAVADLIGLSIGSCLETVLSSSRPHNTLVFPEHPFKIILTSLVVPSVCFPHTSPLFDPSLVSVICARYIKFPVSRVAHSVLYNVWLRAGRPGD
jgi:hypothetical protein